MYLQRAFCPRELRSAYNRVGVLCEKIVTSITAIDVVFLGKSSIFVQIIVTVFRCLTD